jgi:PilZ domain
MNNWFEELLVQNQRRAARYAAPRLVAYYWDGGAPVAHCVRDISVSGLFLLTVQRWYPGTIVDLTLQRMDKIEEGTTKSIRVRARVTRSTDEGVGFRFIVPDREASRQLRRYVVDGAEAADDDSIRAFIAAVLMGYPGKRA